MTKTSRRQLLQMMTSGVVMLPKLAIANERMDGFLESSPVDQTFSNGVLLDSRGEVHQGVGLKLSDGRVHVSKQIAGGTDLKGKWIVPGFVDAGSMLGMFEIGLESGTHDHNESKIENKERLIPAHSYNPLSATVPVTRAVGYTHTFLHPGFGGMVVGQTSLVHLAGLLPTEATVTPSAGLIVSLGSRAKGSAHESRMGIALGIRDLLSEYGPPKKKKVGFIFRREVDPYVGMEPVEKIWTEVADKKKPLLVCAERVDDIDLAIALKEEFSIQLVLVGGAEAWMVADKLAKAQIPVLLGPLDVQPSRFETLHARYDNAAILHKAGVTFAFRSGSNHGVRYTPSLAGLLVAHGLPFAVAIQAMTTNVFDILGVERCVDLRVEKTDLPGSFFFCEGDPLQPSNAVLRMWINGREVSLATRQTRLRDQFEKLK